MKLKKMILAFMPLPLIVMKIKFQRHLSYTVLTGMEMLYKDVLPKGGDIKWHNSSYIQIVESGVMPGIEESSESKKYYLKVPEMNKVKIVNKE
jgi:hypothetical protein